MTADELHSVLDIEGRTVVVVGEEAIRRAVHRFLFWLITAGLLQIGLAGYWVGKLMANQEFQQQQMMRWSVTAPAPAESTRVVLQAFDRRLASIEADIQELRRVLGRPR